MKQLFLLLLPLSLPAQSITATMAQLGGQEVRLEGFRGMQTYPVASATADSRGRVTLPYRAEDYGVGYIMGPDKKPLFVLLTGEDIQLTGQTFSQTESLRVVQGYENQQFARYATEHPRREQAFSAWAYLDKLYNQDSLLSQHTSPRQHIALEKARLRKEDSDFIESLPPTSYVRWFLPTRRLVSSVSTIAQYRPEEIPATIAAFRALNYSDDRLYKSGLFKEAIESHFWLLENCGLPLDSVFAEMRLSIDAVLRSLAGHNRQLNEVTNYLFDLLERHSLFAASEYLALKVLNDTGCTLDGNLAKQLETYRAMKKGNIAPNIAFPPGTQLPGYAADARPASLDGLPGQYTLVVFGASWCPKCAEEVPAIAKLYSKWKAKGFEVVFVALDDDKKAFTDFAATLPFPVVCDFKKWQSPVAEAYYVFGTPTMFLLDKKREILLRPTSVKQVDAWVDWFLVQGNPLK